MTDEKPDVHQRIEELHGTVKEIRERVDALDQADGTRMSREHLDERFQAVDGRFESIDIRLTAMEERFQAVLDLKAQLHSLGEKGQVWSYNIQKGAAAIRDAVKENKALRAEVKHLLQAQDRKLDRLLKAAETKK